MNRVQSMVKVVPFVTEADAFHVSFELVALSSAPDLRRMRVLNRFSSPLAEVDSGAQPVQSLTATLRVNRGLLPVYAEITGADGRTTAAEELGAFLVSPGGGVAGVPLPPSAATMEDYPNCEQSLRDLDARKHQLVLAQNRARRSWAEAHTQGLRGCFIALAGLLPVSLAATVLLARQSTLVSVPALVAGAAFFASAGYFLLRARRLRKEALVEETNVIQSFEAHEKAREAVAGSCPSGKRQLGSLLSAASESEKECSCAGSH
jgi:hypothetical protein